MLIKQPISLISYILFAPNYLHFLTLTRFGQWRSESANQAIWWAQHNPKEDQCLGILISCKTHYGVKSLLKSHLNLWTTKLSLVTECVLRVLSLSITTLQFCWNWSWKYLNLAWADSCWQSTGWPMKQKFWSCTIFSTNHKTVMLFKLSSIFYWLK